MTTSALTPSESEFIEAVKADGTHDEKRLCKIIKRLSTARDAGRDAWQPIETAPKDGTLIMVWSDDGGGLTSFSWFDATDPNAYWYGRKRSEPTHWQPLPQPPSTPSDGEQ